MSDIIPKLLSCCNKQIHGDCRTLACRRPDGSFSCTENIAAAELTRLRTALAVLGAECVAWRDYHNFASDLDEQIEKGERVEQARQLTDSTPGAMEVANG